MMRILILHYFIIILNAICSSKIPKSIANIQISKTITNYALALTALTTSLIDPHSTQASTLQSAYVFASSTSDDPWYNPYNQRIYDTTRKSYLPTHPDLYLIKELGNRNIIVVGEVHSNPCHHRVEFEIIRTLQNNNSKKSRNNNNLAIGMETFYRQHQSILDDFIFNHKNFERLKKESNWDSTWGYDLNYYSKILRYASEHSIRIIGLNIPQPIAHFVSKQGLSNLPSNILKYLPEIDTSDIRHRRQFQDIITSAGKASGQGKLIFFTYYCYCDSNVNMVIILTLLLCLCVCRSLAVRQDVYEPVI